MKVLFSALKLLQEIVSNVKLLFYHVVGKQPVSFSVRMGSQFWLAAELLQLILLQFLEIPPKT